MESEPPLPALSPMGMTCVENEMNSSDRIRVMVVDDHPLMRNGLRDALNTSVHLEVVGEAGDGEEATKTVRELRPDVIVTGCHDAGKGRYRGLPGGHGAFAGNASADANSIERNECWSLRRSPPVRRATFRKYSQPQELIEAVLDVAEGRLKLPDRVVGEVFDLVRRNRDDTSNRATDRLTTRERETLTLFASGRSYAEIAEVRGISTVTVRNTLYRIQDKLGVKSKQELVIWAVRNGLLDDVEVGREVETAREG